MSGFQEELIKTEPLPLVKYSCGSPTRGRGGQPIRVGYEQQGDDRDTVVEVQSHTFPELQCEYNRQFNQLIEAPAGIAGVSRSLIAAT